MAAAAAAAAAGPSCGASEPAQRCVWPPDPARSAGRIWGAPAAAPATHSLHEGKQREWGGAHHFCAVGSGEGGMIGVMRGAGGDEERPQDGRG